MLSFALLSTVAFHGAPLRLFTSRSALVMYGERNYDGGGGGGGGYGGGRGGGGSGDYARDRDDTAQVDVARVEKLVAERSELRAARDFGGADAVRDELQQMGVTVFDRDRTWSASRANEGYDGGRPARGSGGGGRGGGGFGFDRRGGGGGGGGGGEYVRQAGDDALIDVAVVTGLVKERAELRAARDFDGADAVRDELQQMGVIVHDREMEWFVAGSSGRRTEGRGGGGGARGGSSNDRGGGRGGYGNERGGGRGGNDQYGGGFDRGYERAAGDDAPVDVARVEALIKERAELRAARDFQSADAVRGELQQMGVTVSDRDFSWTASPGQGGGRGDRESRFDRPRSPREPLDFGPLGHDYARSIDDSAELPQEAIHEVNRLLAERLEAKMSRRFDVADNIVEDLQSLHSVTVSDKLKQWRADGGLFPSHVRTPGDDDVQIDEAYVQDILQRRALAKKQQDYDQADALAAELKNDLNIWIDDKRATWRVGVPARSAAPGGGNRRPRY